MNYKKTTIHILSIPFIWLPFIPTIIAHIAVFIYVNVAFRMYGIELVKFSNYFILDRQKLPYLSLIEKINCSYCSYANAVYSYMAEIGQRTEYYWCGIKHKNQPNNPVFAYQQKFAKYGDEREYRAIRKKSGHNQ
ncbi:MAG: hypothetical protein WCF91_00605 [bacterium]